ncbi:MAG: LEA type 2 family protein [Leptospirales bacterium]
MNKRFLVALLCLVIFQAQCASGSAKLFKTPEIEYEGFKVKHIDFSGATLEFYLGVVNNNRFGVKLAGMQHRFSMEEEEIFVSEMDDKIHIKPKDRTIVKIPIKVSFKEFKKGIGYIIETRRLPYRINSIITFDTAFGEIPVKIKKEGELEFPAPPDITVEDVDLDKMTIKQIKLIFSLRLENNDEVNLKIKSMNYAIRLNGTPISDGEISSFSEKRRSKTLNITIPVTIEMRNLKRSIIKVIASGKIDYQMLFNLNMKSEYGDYIIAIEKSGTAKL